MKVTIVIPTRNRAALLRQAIQSVLNQNELPEHEIVVADDRSTDETAQVVAEFPTARHLTVESGKPSRTRNAGLRAARGEYVAFLDDDDIWLPNRLAPALARLDADPALGMVYGRARITSLDFSETSSEFPPAPLLEGHPVAALLDNVVHLNTVTLRRGVLDAVGLMDESVYAAEDMDFTARIARAFPVAAQQEVTSLVRMRPDAAGAAPGEAQRWLARYEDDIKLLRRHFAAGGRGAPSWLERLRIVRRRRGWYVLMLSYTALKAVEQGDAEEAAAALRNARRISPIHALRNARVRKASALLRAASATATAAS